MSVPGIDKYPDLKKKYYYELARLKGCRKCQQAKIIRKYTGLVQQRQAK